MKKIINIVAFLILITYLIVVSGFISEKYKEKICNDINVIIEDSVENAYLSSVDVNRLLQRNKIQVLGKHINDVNTLQIEEIIYRNSLVKQCDAFSTVDGKLNIRIEQREPIIRIIDRKNQGYYIDAEGTVFSLSSRFSPHVIVANGHISSPFSINSSENIFSPELFEKTFKHRKLLEFVAFINDNKFWRSQIVQLYINSKGELELVPRIGPHIIEFGEIEDFEEKFWKLKILYTEGFSHVGWNNYAKINLKFKDQIVCTKN